MSSILTNNGAMVALQTLKYINMNLNEVQNQISTGKDIATAKDGSAIWSISKVMEADIAAYQSVSDQLAVGEATVGVGSAGAEQIVNILEEMRALTVSATSETADFTKIEAELVQKEAQITSIIAASQFNGVNLLATDVDGAGGTSLDIITSLNRSGTAAPTVATLTLTGVDLEANITIGGTAGRTNTVTDVASAALLIAEIETDLQTVLTGAATLGATSKRLEQQNTFIGKLTDSMKSGVGALVDADMEAASARLQALQTQQQLGVQALSIANQAPQTILSLFR
jgi:flagellin